MALQPGSLTASGGHGLRTPCKGLPRNQRPRLRRDPPLHAPVAASPRSPPGSALPPRRQLFAGQRPILTPGSPGHTAGLHELTWPGGKGAASDHQGPESRGNAARERPTRASLPPRAAVHMGTREVAGPRVPPSFAWSLIRAPGLQEAVKRSLQALRSHMCRGTLCPTAHGPPHGLRPWQDHAVAAAVEGVEVTWRPSGCGARLHRTLSLQLSAAHAAGTGAPSVREEAPHSSGNSFPRPQAAGSTEDFTANSVFQDKLGRQRRIPIPWPQFPLFSQLTDAY